MEGGGARSVFCVDHNVGRMLFLFPFRFVFNNRFSCTGVAGAAGAYPTLKYKQYLDYGRCEDAGGTCREAQQTQGENAGPGIEPATFL